MDKNEIKSVFFEQIFGFSFNKQRETLILTMKISQ